MEQVTITKLKKMKVEEVKEAMPLEIMADGVVIGTVKAFDDEYKKTISTKCPNCGMIYNVTKPDGKPGFFSTQRPRPKM